MEKKNPIWSSNWLSVLSSQVSDTEVWQPSVTSSEKAQDNKGWSIPQTYDLLGD